MDTLPLVSARAASYAVTGDTNPLWEIIAQDWHPTQNPNGWVNLGVAENVLARPMLHQQQEDT